MLIIKVTKAMLHVFPNNIILEIIESAENLKIRV